MSLHFGQKGAASMYFGNKAVAAVYRGNKLVWQNGPRFVKYHLDFNWSSENKNLVLAETYIDGTTAGNRLLDGGRRWSGSGGGWENIDSSTINKLRNAEDVSIWGVEVELNFSATDISSIGFRTGSSYIDVTNFIFSIIGEAPDGSKTTLLSNNLTISMGQTYTFNL